LASEKAPQFRSSWNANPTMLALTTDSCTPLLWFVADFHREALEQQLDDIDDNLHPFVGCSTAAQKIKSDIHKRWGDSDCPVVVQAG
jgi:hypothetical protein